ncbi:MAG: ferredoxin-thioredoxin reductase catalytic domain-containing protein [Candidatus Hodarchaeales archaeon]|jgi:ferredoxin-thioredoxin reductase catalytic subunit
MNKSKTDDEVKQYISKIAQRNKWVLNKDLEIIQMLIEGLHQNFNRMGYFNCPCRDSQNDRHLDRDIICPCRYAAPDINEFGYCYCSLFFEENYDQNQVTKMIPERRPRV